MSRFFSWTGRLARGDWITQWIGLILLNALVFGAIAAFGFASDRAHNKAGSLAAGISFLAYLVVAAVLMSFPTVKRIHDLNWPGLLYLLFLIPGINLVAIVPCMFFKGTPGPNRYGPDPLRQEAARFFLDNYREHAEAAFPGLERTVQLRAIEESIELLFRRSLDEHPGSIERALARESVRHAAHSLSNQAETAAGREFWINLWSSVEFAVY